MFEPCHVLLDAFDGTVSLIAPTPDALLEAYEVSSAVNRTANDSAVLLEPLREPEMQDAPAPKRVKKEKKDNGQASLF